MQTREPVTKTKTVLPGIAVLYLIACYAFIPYLFILYTTLNFAPTPYWLLAEKPIAFVCVAFLAVTAITSVTGLHLRKPWGAAAAKWFCLGYIIVAIATGLRIYYAFMDLDLFDDYFGNFTLTILPAAILALIPAFYAWNRYFAKSLRIRAALGVTPAPDAEPDVTPDTAPASLPPLSVALLQTMCAMLIIFAFFWNIAPVLFGEVSPVVLLISPAMPIQTVFFAAITLAALRLHRKNAVYLSLALWFAAIAASMFIPNTCARRFIYDAVINATHLLKMLENINMFSPGTYMLAVILAALWWILDSTGDAAWFGGQKTGEPRNNYAAILLLAWTVLSILPAVAQAAGLAVFPFADGQDPAEFHTRLAAGAALAAGILLPGAAVWLWGKRKKSAAVFSLITVLLYAAYPIASTLAAMPEVTEDYLAYIKLNMIFVMMSCCMAPVVGAAYFARLLARRGKACESGSESGAPLPLIALQLLCLVILVDVLQYIAAPHMMRMFLDGLAADLSSFVSFERLPGTRYLLLAAVTAAIIPAIGKRRGGMLYALLPAQAMLILAVLFVSYSVTLWGYREPAFADQYIVASLVTHLKLLPLFWCYLFCSGQASGWLFPQSVSGEGAPAGPDGAVEEPAQPLPDGSMPTPDNTANNSAATR